MKTTRISRYFITLLILTSGMYLLSSCVVQKTIRLPLVKVTDIIQMSKDGISSKDIINKIELSHTAYSLKADQLARLQKQGVSDSVINYMEQTHFNYMMHKMEKESSYYWEPWGSYFYGSPYFRFPYYYGWNYWGPSFNYNYGAYYGSHSRGGNRR